MAGENNQLSDKALSVFAFAAYHELVSGQKVSSVIRRDHAGHQADPDGVSELERRNLIKAEEDFLHFSPEAKQILETVLAALRGRLGENEGLSPE
jgi:hypothetical protein